MNIRDIDSTMAGTISSGTDSVGDTSCTRRHAHAFVHWPVAGPKVRSKAPTLLLHALAFKRVSASERLLNVFWFSSGKLCDKATNWLNTCKVYFARSWLNSLRRSRSPKTEHD